jgi:hypothetical protein
MIEEGHMTRGAGNSNLFSTFVIIIIGFAICFSFVQFSTVNNIADVHPDQENEITSTKFLDGNVDNTISEVPEGLSTKEWNDIQGMMKTARYYPTWDDISGTHVASNPKNQWDATFHKGAAALSSSSDENWTWQLVPSRYGYEGSVYLLDPDPKVVVDKNRIEFVYNENLVGWYVNDEKGLEHGFDITSPPQIRTHGDLVIEMTFETSLVSRSASDGNSIVFLDRSGEEVLNYGKLLVTDVTGRELPAEFIIITDFKSIVISIEDSTATYPIIVDPLVAYEIKNLTASDGEEWDQFGKSVAISGDTIVVGADEDRVEANFTQGSAYVFQRNTGGTDCWGEIKKLTASDGAADDRFGCSVSISGDTIVVGAYWDDIGLNDFQGSAYVFERNNGGTDNWGEVKNINASDGAEDDWFGYSVSISGDTVVVGVYSYDVGANINQGSAYVYERNNGGTDNWGEVKRLTASDGAQGDRFGGSVSIFGNTVVVGARYDDVGANDTQGSAYVFQRNNGGADNWGEVKKVTGGDSVQYDRFGWSVSIFGDTVVVGATEDEVGGNDNQGSAYVFQRNTGGIDNWGEIKKLTASDGEALDNFGFSVSIYNDTIVVGALWDDIGANLGQGSAYVFQRNIGGTDNWGEVVKINASDGAQDDWFGCSVSIYNYMFVVGARRKDMGENILQGSAYIYYLEKLFIITTIDDTNADEDVLYSADYDVLAPGEWGTLNWSLATNATWLNIIPGTGELSGTPNNSLVGSYWVNVSVDDGNGSADWSNFTLVVNNIAPNILTTDDTTVDEDAVYGIDYASDDDGQGNITWSLSTNATWLNMVQSTGILSGTPDNSHVGSYWVNVSVDDGNGGFDWSNFTLFVNNIAPNILTTDDTTADEDALYSINYASDEDGQGNITWSLSTNATWLNIVQSTGVLSGAINNSHVGSYWVNVGVDDGNGGVDWSNFTLVVNNVAPNILTTDNFTTEEYALYSIDYASDDDDQGNITWSLSTNATWLNMVQSMGMLSGKSDYSHVGSFWVNVSVDDGNGGIDWSNFTLVVNNIVPNILTTDDPTVDEDAMYGIDYASDEDGKGDVTWTLWTNADGWLAINTTTGFLYGTPDNGDVGSWTVNVTVSDGNGGIDYSNFTLEVCNVAPTIMIFDNITAIEDIAYNVHYVSDEDGQGRITWNLETNATWLFIDGNGWLNGYPDNSDVGIFWVNISVNDGKGGTDYHNFTLTVINTPLTITTEDVTIIDEDVHYSNDYNTDDDGQGRITWILETNATWLFIDGNGWLNGTPDDIDVGNYWVIVSVDDGNGGQDHHDFTLTVINTPLMITTQDVTISDEDVQYSNDYNAAGDGQGRLTWNLETNATWLFIDDNGLLNGTPDNSDVGIFWVNVSVDDGNGGLDFRNFTLIINNVPPTITTTNEKIILTGNEYSVDYDSTDDGQGTITWSLNTNAKWLDIDSLTGVLSGTPTNLNRGIYWVNISINDGNGGISSTNFMLTVLLDTDGDGIPNEDDEDDDDDGVLDENDYYPLDSTKWKEPLKDGTDINIFLIILVIIIMSVILAVLLIKRRREEEPEVWQIEGEDIEDESWNGSSFEGEMPSPPPPPPEDMKELPPPPPPP